MTDQEPLDPDGIDIDPGTGDRRPYLDLRYGPAKVEIIGHCTDCNGSIVFTDITDHGELDVREYHTMQCDTWKPPRWQPGVRLCSPRRHDLPTQASPEPPPFADLPQPGALPDPYGPPQAGEGLNLSALDRLRAWQAELREQGFTP